MNNANNAREQCSKVLISKIYNNDYDLLKKIELLHKLEDYLLNIKISKESMKAIILLIKILRSIDDAEVQDKLYNKNLTVIIPSLCPLIQNAILADNK